ncbi:unnamed protein product [Porites lobata]|uniref:Uncharacterized protein n=1 Tax=Porites lobata TaxID=104759 RepID=A0ABN8QUH3_9CNID|nr:unnamed protein product [Porites lobata]
MYNALVMPYFNYCGAVWGNINKGLADKLQKLQNRAARILTFSNYDVRSSVLLDELGWERLEYIDDDDYDDHERAMQATAF